LKRYTIPNPNALYILPYFQNFADDLVTWIRMSIEGESCRSDTKISIPLNHMQITPADTCQAIAYTHPGLLRKRLAWQILHL
jgi:hypothetical protein